MSLHHTVYVGPDNGLVDWRHQAIILINVDFVKQVSTKFMDQNALQFFSRIVLDMNTRTPKPQTCSKSWWRHQMETFSALLALCAGNSPVPVNSPHKGQWRGALMFSLICARINDWVNNREAGDLRRHRGHYEVNVMFRSYVDACVF